MGRWDPARLGSKEGSPRPCTTPSEAARCASTEDQQAPSPPLLQTSSKGVAKAALYCAHRTTLINLNDPSKLACFPSLGRAPMLVYVRPSNEALLRARVPGAQDRCGYPSNPFYRGGSTSKNGTWPLPFLCLRGSKWCVRIAARQGLFHKRPWWR